MSCTCTSVGDFLPVAVEEFLFVGLELAFGRAHQVVRAALAEEFQVVVADDAAVKDPEAAGFPELLFDRVEDVLAAWCDPAGCRGRLRR